MPELPDITAYLEALETRISGATLETVRLGSPFLLRTIDPPLAAAHGARVVELRRIGKRIAISLDNGCWLVIHLMIAGRLHWHPVESKKVVKLTRRDLAAFDFSTGTLRLTEAGTKRRASLAVVRDPQTLDPGGMEPLECSAADFAARLRSENHTLKRSLTDPHLFSGIGNAYSDEILHTARLSPIALSQKLTDAEVDRLHSAVRDTLQLWIERLRSKDFPEKVTAFRPEMAVHGRFGEPCPVCQTNVQRIRYAENETNYCPTCQTGGRLLADRSLSRLLRSDWPRSMEEMEQRRTHGKL
jgi:formamidopyrimidine-DNA glycosylase